MRKITNEELGRPTAGEFAAMEKMPVTVVLDNVRSLQNVGAFFRTGDAFAVEHIALCGITAVPPNRDIHKTALGAELTVPWSYYETTEACIDRLHADGYEVLAVEQVGEWPADGRFQINLALRPACAIFAPIYRDYSKSSFSKGRFGRDCRYGIGVFAP